MEIPMARLPSRPTRRSFLKDGSLLVAAASWGVRATASVQEHGTPAATAEALMARGVSFLRARQDENGGWSTARKEPGITALVVTALLKTKLVTPSEPVITRGLGYLEQYVRPQGGFDAAHANYTTAIALMAYQEANAGGKFDTLIHGGQDS
jgi:squalene-hopene/tetraprenyl-beta-curcumene cyclase